MGIFLKCNNQDVLKEVKRGCRWIDDDFSRRDISILFIVPITPLDEDIFFHIALEDQTHGMETSRST